MMMARCYVTSTCKSRGREWTEIHINCNNRESLRSLYLYHVYRTIDRTQHAVLGNSAVDIKISGKKAVRIKNFSLEIFEVPRVAASGSRFFLRKSLSYVVTQSNRSSYMTQEVGFVDTIHRIFHACQRFKRTLLARLTNFRT